MKVKVFLKNLKNRIRLLDIWTEVEKYVKDNLDMGNIVEVLEKEQEKYYTCPKGCPSEYCSRENITEKFVVKTDKEIKLILVQKYLGLNFEAPCDNSIFMIYDENNNLLYDSSNKENNKSK